MRSAKGVTRTSKLCVVDHNSTNGVFVTGTLGTASV
jgi:hypothetical protein